MSEEVEENSNYEHFRDCFSAELLRAATQATRAPKRRRRGRNFAATGPTTAGSGNTESTGGTEQGQHAEELAEFIDYLATEIFESFPDELKTLDFRSWRDNEHLQTQYALPLTEDSLRGLDLPVDTADTLQTYELISNGRSSDSHLPASSEAFLIPIITAYIAPLTTPPPASSATRTSACELCGRWWIPLSYHHLIPRFVHDKAVKRGWHKKEDLQNVAWLCGACHRFVHQFKGHEELARDYFTVERLLEADEVQSFTAWVGRLRWKGGRVRSWK